MYRGLGMTKNRDLYLFSKSLDIASSPQDTLSDLLTKRGARGDG
jgi:hypothetical protein